MSTTRVPFTKFLLRSRVRVTRIVEPGEYVQVGDGRYLSEEPPEIHWQADYDDTIFYRRGESVGLRIPYSEVRISAIGDSYDEAMAELAEIARGQGWEIE